MTTGPLKEDKGGGGRVRERNVMMGTGGPQVAGEGLAPPLVAWSWRKDPELRDVRDLETLEKARKWMRSWSLRRTQPCRHRHFSAGDVCQTSKSQTCVIYCVLL